MDEQGWPDTPRLEVLDHHQCLGLLETVRVGRLCFIEHGLPAVQPVNFRLFRGDVVIRVAGGPKLGAAVAHDLVAFEADDLHPELRSGWSVTVVGALTRITDVAELVDVSGIWLVPWAPGNRPNFLRVHADRITGRRLHPANA